MVETEKQYWRWMSKLEDVFWHMYGEDLLAGPIWAFRYAYKTYGCNFWKAAAFMRQVSLED